MRCFNDINIFDADTLSWKQEPVYGDVPDPRGGHTATLVGTEMYVYGGANSEDTFGDTFKFDLVKSRWTQVTPVLGEGLKSGPDRRTNHAAAADVRGRIYVFGGYDAQGRFLNDLWVLSVSGAVPQPGPHDAQYVNMNLQRDPVSSSRRVVWERPAPTGALPLAREGHSLTLVDRRLILIGGYTSEAKAANDAYMYDLESQQWERLQTAGGLPPPRQAHSAIRHGRDIVIAGGCDVSDLNPVCYNDVWSLNSASMTWTQRSSETVTWFPREGHSATFVRGRMFAIGGCQLGSECFNDVTELDTHDPCPAACGAHGECETQAVGKSVEQFCKCTAPGFTGHDCMQPLSCPNDCGAHGTCSQAGECICQNGFMGADCAIELPCPGTPTKCTGRGACLASGLCQCTTGYSGPACEDETPMAILDEPCPLDCCGNGECDAGGCRCKAGWYGTMCAVNETTWEAFEKTRAEKRALLLLDAKGKRQQAAKVSLLAEALTASAGAETLPMRQEELANKLQELDSQTRTLRAGADNAERQANSLRLDSHDQLVLLGGATATCYTMGHEAALEVQKAQNVQAKHASRKVNQKMSALSFAVNQKNPPPMAGPGAMHARIEPPEGKDFGIAKINQFGHTGVGEPECEDSCNFRGICQSSTCYCQPGYYGDACAMVREVEKGTFPLAMVIAIGGGCVLASFAVTLCFLLWRLKEKRSKESKIGYNV